MRQPCAAAPEHSLNPALAFPAAQTIVNKGQTLSTHTFGCRLVQVGTVGGTLRGWFVDPQRTICMQDVFQRQFAVWMSADVPLGAVHSPFWPLLSSLLHSAAIAAARAGVLLD